MRERERASESAGDDIKMMFQMPGYASFLPSLTTRNTFLPHFLPPNVLNAYSAVLRSLYVVITVIDCCLEEKKKCNLVRVALTRFSLQITKQYFPSEARRCAAAGLQSTNLIACSL